MRPSIEEVHLPALAGTEPLTNRTEVVRPLTDADKVGLEHARRVLAVALPITNMYKVLSLNYDDLVAFTKTLAARSGHAVPPIINANRYIFNYLAAADALLEYFARIYKRQCRIEKVADTDFDDFRKQLEKTDDDFQFFSKFRNHVLHSGLPVGLLTQSDSHGAGETWSITYSSSELLKDSRGEWRSCRLLTKESNIDLIVHLERFHRILMGQVFKEIVSCFHKDMHKAHEFHHSLAEEVRAIDPTLLPCVLTSRSNDGKQFHWTFSLLPMDFIGSLGIRINTKDSARGG
jgi:hypothetical protein